jgi:hypothetical protein
LNVSTNRSHRACWRCRMTAYSSSRRISSRGESRPGAGPRGAVVARPPPRGDLRDSGTRFELVRRAGRRGAT